jgi:hypothetical protein
MAGHARLFYYIKYSIALLSRLIVVANNRLIMTISCKFLIAPHTVKNIVSKNIHRPFFRVNLFELKKNVSFTFRLGKFFWIF